MKTILFLTITLQIFISNISISQYSSPESITYDTTGKRYFISNTSSSKIVQRDRQGNVTDFVTVGGSIHGITVHNGKVYVCNGTRVRGYDLITAAEVFNVLISGSVFLNDLAIDNSGIMYVSDFNGRRIYKVNTANNEYWIYVPATTNQPNGLYVDTQRNRLLICCWGASAPVKAVSFADSSIANLITTSYSNCDGISLDRNDNVYISTWGIQSVARYDINFVNPPVIVASGLSNPADIYVNKNTDTLAVPNAGNSTVAFFHLDIPSGIKQINNIANSFELHQNYPNPFNPSTNLEFGISDLGFVSLKIYDLLGKEVLTLVNKELDPGSYKYTFDASNLTSGIYFYKLSANGNTDVKRMTLVK
ncbi:MAG TPA: T9SS type A sorting domain-containing protein [Ignavibacteria bacterium]|nr:T9SS type A sorting domain-containing protein [Ignavibacteria bacterium]